MEENMETVWCLLEFPAKGEMSGEGIDQLNRYSVVTHLTKKFGKGLEWKRVRRLIGAKCFPNPKQILKIMFVFPEIS